MSTDEASNKRARMDRPVVLPEPYSSHPHVGLIDLERWADTARCASAAKAARSLGLEKLYVRVAEPLPSSLKEAESYIAALYAAASSPSAETGSSRAPFNCIVLVPPPSLDMPSPTSPLTSPISAALWAAVASAPELDCYISTSAFAASALNDARTPLGLGKVARMAINVDDFPLLGNSESSGNKSSMSSAANGRTETDSKGSETSRAEGSSDKCFSEQAVCCGGTWDRLHDGHKVLLSVAALSVERGGRLVVGIANDAMVANKTLADLVEPASYRAAVCMAFLRSAAVATTNILAKANAASSTASVSAISAIATEKASSSSNGSTREGSSGVAQRKTQPMLIIEECILSDPAGPAASDPTLTAIVASRETESGCDWCNKQRLSVKPSALKPLRVNLVECYGADGAPLTYWSSAGSSSTVAIAAEKLSSSSLRALAVQGGFSVAAAATTTNGVSVGSNGNSLGSVDVVSPTNGVGSSAPAVALGQEWCRRATNGGECAELPYVIGLTGGIACGKSFVGQRLKALFKERGMSGQGANVEKADGMDSDALPVLDADTYGHRAYAPGTACCAAILKTFGSDVGTSQADGSVSINRAALGALVFDPVEGPARLAQLNAIVWPPLLELLIADLKALKARPQGCAVAVVEAAVLIEAGWHDTICDETWLVLADKPVALSRFLKRNPNLTESDAEARLAAAPSARGRIPHVQAIVVNNSTSNSSSASSTTEPGPVDVKAVGLTGSNLRSCDAILLPLLSAARARALDPTMFLAQRPKESNPLLHRWRTLCLQIAAGQTPGAIQSGASSLNKITAHSSEQVSESNPQVLPDWVATWWRRLRDRYTHPSRHYHALAHVGAVLAVLDALEPEQPVLTALAAFFHDAVYESTAPSGDNERASAALFREFAASVAADRSNENSGSSGSTSVSKSSDNSGLLTAQAVEDIAAWIERTAAHLPPAGSNTATSGDLAKFLDADLAVLGASEAAYNRYAQQVRLEYHCYGDKAFRVGRAKVLKHFLNAPSLYFTPEAKNALESKARVNLAAEIKQLESA